MSTALPAGKSLAGTDQTWLQIENAYIRVYTDASEARALPLVEEVDRFRQALLIITNWRIPANAPPVEVLILDTGFRELIGNWAAGVAVPLDGAAGTTSTPILVMPVEGQRGVDDRVVLRHEYVHALSNYRESGSRSGTTRALQSSIRTRGWRARTSSSTCLVTASRA